MTQYDGSTNRKEQEMRNTIDIRDKKTKKNEGEWVASEQLTVRSHITIPIHDRSQCEGGNNAEKNEWLEDPNEDNLNQRKVEEDDDDLVIGTPLKTYVLQTKSSSGNNGIHTLKGDIQDKGKNIRKILSIQLKIPTTKENLEDLKKTLKRNSIIFNDQKGQAA